tara:strand:- start:27 stop:146 length:120 start_codon:yes stop_codon:yes gene_type:complete
MELFLGLLMIIIIGVTIFQILEQRRKRKQNKSVNKNKNN